MIETITKLFAVLFLIQSSTFVLINMLFLIVLRKPTNIRKNRNNQFSVAMAIPCYNEGGVIERKVANLLHILRPNGSFQVYVVDDGSTDNTFQIANEFKRLNGVENLFVLKNPGRHGKIKALSWFVNNIEEDIVVITDADVLLEKNSLVNLIANFDDPTVGAVCGNVVVKEQNKEFTTKTEILYRKIFDFWRRAESNLDSCSVFNDQLMAFRKKVLQKALLNEDVHICDQSLIFKTRRLGYRAVYEPQALLFETADPSFLGQMKRKIRRATAITHTLLKNLKMMGQYGSFGRVICPISMYNHITSPMLTLVLLFLLPIVLFKYPILLLFGFLLTVPIIRTAVFGFITAQLALVIGLLVPQNIERWETTRASNERR